LFVASLVLFIIPACVKEGPPGLDGLDGADGANGANGADGADGNVTCIACHSESNMAAVEDQYEMSVHALSPHAGSPTYIYAGAGANRKSCAVCHTHEGFLEVMFTGRDSLTSALAAPTRIGCETCHSTHVSFDFETDGQDYALRSTSPVNLITFDTEDQRVDIDPSTNLCINCHQSREGAPSADGDGNFTITSSRYGPHHGPQGNLLEGIDGYEVAGSVSYPGTKSFHHRNSGGCISCHMHEGSHTFEPNLASCTDCHDATDIDDIQTEVEDLLDQLHDALLEEGSITATGSTVSGNYPISVVGATYNYKLIEEDRSMGIHNPAYIKALLKNSLESLQ
jgi:hypothetical protein